MSSIALVVAASAMVGGLQAPAAAKTDRVAAIWDSAQVRMDQQIDIWFNAGDFPKSIQALRVEQAAFPNDYEVATNHGWMLENVQDYDAAIVSYKQYLRDNPKDPDGALPLANLYFRQKKYKEVPPLLDKVVMRTPPPHGNVFRILAHSYERTGRLQESQQVWMRFLSVDPNDGPAKVNLKRVEDKIASKNG